MQRASEQGSAVVLNWAGKTTPVAVTPVTLPVSECFARLGAGAGLGHAPANALYYGDNLGVLANLVAEGRRGGFRLIYADPPYSSGVVWARKVRVRGPRQPGENGLLDEQPQYDDNWDESAYLQFLYERLFLLRDLLAEDGTLWLHCDHRRAHHVRCLLEEVFGPKQYLNTITWRSQTARGAKVNAFYFPNSAHTILVFAKNRNAPPCWNPPRKTLVLSEAEAAAEFMRDERGFFRTSDPGTFSFESLQRLHGEGRLYAPYGGEIAVDAANRRVYCTRGGNIGVKYYLADLGGGRYGVERAVDNIWDDIPGLGTTPGEDLGYPTQKTEALLTRVLSAATQPGDWVLDPFAGSGTTLAVAQKLGRRWVGCDAAYGAIQTARRRLQAVIQAQVEEGAGNGAAGELGFAVHGEAPASDSAAPQVRVAITPIAGEPARIRVLVEQVTWPDRSPAEEWRTLVESIAVAVDEGAADEGDGVLRVVFADAPLRRTQLVRGEYEVAVAAQGVVVRVTDIWGREGWNREKQKTENARQDLQD